MSNTQDQNADDLRAELLKCQEAIAQALAFLAQGNVEEAQQVAARGLSAVEIKSLVVAPRARTEPTKVPEGSRVIEGVFDGQHMIGDDGRQYLVPQNYASKSKLVEGDLMKLSITPDGAFVYKQIGPIDRRRIKGNLIQDEQQFWHVSDGVHSWRILTASVSFFKGKAGD